jgi:hypothetical protein
MVKFFAFGTLPVVVQVVPWLSLALQRSVYASGTTPASMFLQAEPGGRAPIHLEMLFQLWMLPAADIVVGSLGH